MRLLIAGAAVLVLSMAVSMVRADEGDKPQTERGPRGGGREGFMKMLLEKFDTDKDGKLSDEERAAARADREKRMAERGEEAGPRRRGPGGEGRGQFNREEFMKKFDKDGDGKLSDEERAAVRAEFEKMRAERGGEAGPRRRGPGGEGRGPEGEGRGPRGEGRRGGPRGEESKPEAKPET